MRSEILKFVQFCYALTFFTLDNYGNVSIKIVNVPHFSRKPYFFSLQTSFEPKSQRRSFNAQQNQNFSISPMSIPPPPPPLPSIQPHMYAGSNQDNRSHLDSMNPRHYTQQKYQPKIPIMYSSPTNYPQQHASGKFTMNETTYNKPYIKATMSPHMRSPQHPGQQQATKYHMDNNTNVNSKMDLKSKYQQKLQFPSAATNNNYQFGDSMNDIRMLQSLEIRRQEIIGKQCNFLNFVFFFVLLSDISVTLDRDLRIGY